MSKLALEHFVSRNRKKELISVGPRDLNEGENISASAVVQLSFSFIFSLLLSK